MLILPFRFQNFVFWRVTITVRLSLPLGKQFGTVEKDFEIKRFKRQLCRLLGTNLVCFLISRIRLRISLSHSRLQGSGVWWKHLAQFLAHSRQAINGSCSCWSEKAYFTTSAIAFGVFITVQSIRTTPLCLPYFFCMLNDVFMLVPELFILPIA